MSLSRPHLLLLSAALALVVALAAPVGASASGCGGAAAAHPAGLTSKASVRTTVCLINRERTRRGLGRVRLNGRLSTAAARHARDMVRRDYFSHVSLSGATFVQRIRRTGYVRGARAWWVGENLAWGSGSRATPRAIVRAWMDSPGHRANILKGRFREVGLAVVRGAPVRAPGAAATYVNTFGTRR